MVLNTPGILLPRQYLPSHKRCLICELSSMPGGYNISLAQLNIGDDSWETHAER